MSDGAASPGPSRRRVRWFFVAGTAVLVLAVGGGVFALRGEGPVEPDHQPTETAVQAHATPMSASEEAWTWDAPEHATVIDMHVLPFGAAVELDDGVVAIDGTSGEEVWHYRRPDATVASASVTPGGDLLALAFEPDASEEESDADETGESEPDHWDQVVLDANTGEISTEHQIEQRPDRQGYERNPDIGPPTSNIGAPQTGVHHLTENARVVYELDSGFHVQARDLHSDEVVWSDDEAVSSPGESLEDGGKMYPGQLLVADDVVLASNVHADAPGSWDLQFDLTALRAGSGEVLWQESWEIGKLHDGHDPTLSASPSGGEVPVKFRPEHSGLLLDLETGEELATDLWSEDGGLLAVMDDGYVSHTSRPQGVTTTFTYHELDGDSRREVELPDHDGGHARAYTLATPETLIAVHAGPDPSEEALVTSYSWDDGEQTASFGTTLSASSDHGDGSAPSEQAAEQPRYLQAVPGAVVALDPETGRVTAFAP